MRDFRNDYYDRKLDEGRECVSRLSNEQCRVVKKDGRRTGEMARRKKKKKKSPPLNQISPFFCGAGLLLYMTKSACCAHCMAIGHIIAKEFLSTTRAPQITFLASFRENTTVSGVQYTTVRVVEFYGVLVRYDQNLFNLRLPCTNSNPRVRKNKWPKSSVKRCGFSVLRSS